jgi:hypothetical protein
MQGVIGIGRIGFVAVRAGGSRAAAAAGTSNAGLLMRGKK